MGVFDSILKYKFHIATTIMVIIGMVFMLTIPDNYGTMTVGTNWGFVGSVEFICYYFTLIFGIIYFTWLVIVGVSTAINGDILLGLIYLAICTLLIMIIGFTFKMLDSNLVAYSNNHGLNTWSRVGVYLSMGIILFIIIIVCINKFLN